MTLGLIVVIANSATAQDMWTDQHMMKSESTDELKDSAMKPLGMNAFLKWPKVEVPAGRTVVMNLSN